MTSPAPFSSSERGSGYQSLFSLDQGGMAEVELALSRGPRGFSKLVALKSLRRELVTDLDHRHRFMAEARLSARMNHPNVVQIYQVIDATQPRIVMEYLEGQSLATIQQRASESFTLAMQLLILSEALNGLHYAHELCDYDGSPLGIVHRDVSPQNIFVTYDGRVKVLDFGIAKRTSAEEHTRGGVLKGKFPYMPREQLLGEPLDRRADIHAVGAILWHAAAGVRLWEGMDPSEAMRCLIAGRIPLPSSVRLVDPRLEHITMKALAPDPHDRYATAAELQRALEDYLASCQATCSLREIGEYVLRQFASERGERSRLIHAKVKDSATPRTANESAVANPNTGVLSTASTVAPLPARRRTPLLVAAAGLLLVAAGGGVYLWAQSSKAPASGGAAVAGQAAAPDWAQVRILVFPANATLTVDGEAIHERPAVLSTPRDNSEHQVVAQLEGYERLVKRLRFDRDISLELELQPQALKAATSASARPEEADTGLLHRSTGHAATPRTPASSPPAGTRSAEEAPSCSPPFYYQNGIKVYNRDCL